MVAFSLTLICLSLLMLSRYLKTSLSQGVKSVRARVTNIIDELQRKITVEEFRDLLLDYMKKEYPEMTEYVFSDEKLAEINRIKETKFGTWDWNYGSLLNTMSVVELNSLAVRLKSSPMSLNQNSRYQDLR